MRRLIEETLVEFVQLVTVDDQVNENTDLVEKKYLDSLLVGDLVNLIEAETGVTLSTRNSSVANVRTIAQLTRLVEREKFHKLFQRQHFRAATHCPNTLNFET